MVVSTGNNKDIWIWDIVGENITRLTIDEAEDRSSLWTPDSKRIVFFSRRKNSAIGGVCWKSADGTGEVEKLGSVQDHTLLPWSWSGDEKTFIVQRVTLGGTAAIESYIGTLSLEGDHEWETLLKEKFIVAHPQISPNGRWMAYNSTESGQLEVYVRPFPDVDKGKWKVSKNSWGSPRWSPDGRELFYRNGDSMMAVPVELEPTFKSGSPKVLFKGNYVSEFRDDHSWDIHPNGKRFLMMKPLATTDSTSTMAGPRKINIVLNWFEELKRRVPVK